ncbi:MAG TPA: CDP-alcohol phosphatidyltransferase family protein [Thermoleophilaceae bacterium]|nr:CDP-alcohol phosphatidyltransferase family protein [Thermoleophilaceae bacterium]
MTLPNAVGFVRLALVPAFLVLALSSGDGRDPAADVLFVIVAVGDYLDGLLARVTGQYSRLGAMLDPLTDRLLVVSGAVVCWRFDLLPRWALAVLAARELLVLALTQVALRRGLELEINPLGRWAVWPVMGALGGAIMFESWVTEVLLYLGLVLSLASAAMYVRDGSRRLHRAGGRQASSST